MVVFRVGLQVLGQFINAVGRRRRMLDYVRDRDIQRYRDLIAKLGLRR